MLFKIRFSRRRGFSLVEVVVATGIFAIAIVSVIGLVAAVTKNVTEIRDGDDASRVVANLQSKLQDIDFITLRGYMGNLPANVDQRLYSSRDGNKIGRGGLSAIWDKDNVLSPDEENAQKFFLIQLLPNDTLSPSPSDNSAGYLAFTVKLLYPAYLGDGTVVADSSRSQQSVIVVPVAVTR